VIEVTIPLRSHDEAILVLGPYDRNAKLLRQVFDIEIYTRGGNLRIRGSAPEVTEVRGRVEHLLGKIRKGRDLEPRDAEEILLGKPANSPAARSTTSGAIPPASREAAASSSVPPSPIQRGFVPASELHRSVPSRVGIRPRAVEPRGANQRHYLEAMEENALTFGVGVAGTGKTFLAVTAAVRALREGTCRRLVITRPVVEAGEHLGFLPGDLQAKLNPYMRPIYDALFDLIGFEDANRLEEAGVIEVAPLAYMRGRTISNAFVILDEAQNTTVGQMKMFLTRLGENSVMVVTGDPTQSDIEEGRRNGFLDALQRLRGFEGVGVAEFSTDDIVRHPLVAQIVRAYEAPGGPRGAPRR
jgi:phosphate starvation-inducible protein PhoH and related proteins